MKILLTGNHRKTFRWTDQNPRATDRRLRCTSHQKLVLTKVAAKDLLKKTRGMKIYKCEGVGWHVGHERKELRYRDSSKGLHT
jgi:hypothetical protein